MRTSLERQYPWLDDRSAWREVVRHDEDHRHATDITHGCWVLGNGRVFAVRHEEPFSRLSHLLGPTPACDGHFTGWGSQQLVLQQGQSAVSWESEEAFRVRRTGILGAELQAPDLRMLILDVAPPDWPLIFRAVSIRNTGKILLKDLHLHIVHDGLPVGQIYPLETGWEIVRPERRLRVTVLNAPVEIENALLRIPLPELAPGEDETIYLALICGRDEDEVGLLNEKLMFNPGNIPCAVYRWWQRWMHDTLDVVTDDPRLGDLFDDTKTLIACQQGLSGGIFPLTNRSSSTATEELAPLRFLLANGKFADVRKTLEARYEETCRQEHFAFRLSIDRPVGIVPLHEPDWEQLPPPPPWTAMSVVHAHWEYWRQSGDLSLPERHFRYLRWMVERQDVSPEGLVAFGGDEPFLGPFQRHLPAEMRAALLPDPAPFHLMRPYPWGAAPAIALIAAAEQLSAMAQTLGEEESRQRLNELSTRLRNALEQHFLLRDEGYYAAARSRISDQQFTLPHLPTALAPFAAGATAPARSVLDATLQYLLQDTGFPMTTPQVAAFPGSTPGELLAAMAHGHDRRFDQVYRATLAGASPAGEYRAVYLPGEGASASNGLGSPSHTAANVLGILHYLVTGEAVDGTLSLSPHLPPGATHLHVESLIEEGKWIEVIVANHDGKQRVQLGNAGRENVHVSLGESRAYLLHPGTRHQWFLPLPESTPEVMPAPHIFTTPVPEVPATPLLVLTVDGQSFTDWQQQYGAVLLDASMPLPPEMLAYSLVRSGQRRYAALYLDVPHAGAAWVGLSDDFWNHPLLQQTLEEFRNLGGMIASTTFVDRWFVQVDALAPCQTATRHGWITLPHVEAMVTGTGIVPWESTGDEFIELLLYATDGCNLEIDVNGKPLWQRGNRPEGQRVHLNAIFHPGENTVTVRAKRRSGRGFGFSLGIRGRLNLGQQENKQAA